MNSEGVTYITHELGGAKIHQKWYTRNACQFNVPMLFSIDMNMNYSNVGGPRLYEGRHWTWQFTSNYIDEVGVYFFFFSSILLLALISSIWQGSTSPIGNSARVPPLAPNLHPLRRFALHLVPPPHTLLILPRFILLLPTYAGDWWLTFPLSWSQTPLPILFSLFPGSAALSSLDSSSPHSVNSENKIAVGEQLWAYCQLSFPEKLTTCSVGRLKELKI